MIAILGGGNCHALAIARKIPAFGIGRNNKKPPALWQAPPEYIYYQAHLGTQLSEVLFLLDTWRPEIIVNIAAQGEGAASFGDKSPLFYETNCVMLSRLVEELRTRKYLKLFIHIGSSEVYGPVDRAVPEDYPLNPSSPYSVSKAAFDQHLQIMYRVHGFPSIIIRPSNCYTKGQQLHRIIPRAVICGVYGQKLTLAGGAARKSFLDSEDLGDAVRTIIEKGTVGQIYNVGPDEPTAIRDVVAAVSRQVEIKVETVPPRLGEDSCYWLDSSKIKALGWKPSICLDEGITRVIQWARQYPELRDMDYQARVTA